MKTNLCQEKKRPAERQASGASAPYESTVCVIIHMLNQVSRFFSIFSLDLKIPVIKLAKTMKVPFDKILVPVKVVPTDEWPLSEHLASLRFRYTQDWYVYRGLLFFCAKLFDDNRIAGMTQREIYQQGWFRSACFGTFRTACRRLEKQGLIRMIRDGRNYIYELPKAEQALAESRRRRRENELCGGTVP